MLQQRNRELSSERKVTQQELVKALGYDIHYDVNKGTFEVAGVSKALMEEFSQRRKDIEQTAEEFGYEGGKAMEKAALGSRDAKKSLLKGFTTSELAMHNFSVAI